MTSLTRIAIQARKAVKYGIIGIIVLIILRVLFGVGRGIFLALRGPSQEPPNAALGVLPEIEFPAQVRTLPDISYTIETATGGLPDLGDRATVYQMPPIAATLDTVERANETANGLGFEGSSPIQSTDVVYRYNHRTVPSSLEINVANGTFSINYQLSFDPTPLREAPPSTEEAVRTVVNFLDRANKLPDDYQNEDGEVAALKTEYLVSEGQKLVAATAQSEAELIKVNLLRRPYNELPSVTADPNESNVWMILSGDTNRGKNIIAAEYHYFPVNGENNGTYFIKTAEEALALLESGEGYVANLGLNVDGNVTIRNIYLAYYDPPSAANYYQPVVVFEGDRGFVAYVAAVDYEHYSPEAPAESGEDASGGEEGETSTQE